MSDKHYKIVRLESANIKRLTAVSIEPDGAVVEITGQNGAGKSSLLDAIFWALSGKDVIQKEPIRRGEQKAHVKLDMGTLIITRRMTAQEDGSYTTSLVVESDDGMTAKSPQKLLDSIVGELTADPLAFTRLKPEQQFDQLKQFVAGFDFAEWARRRKAVFDKRSDVNRRAKDLAAQAAGVTVPEGEPPALVDETALVAALREAGAHNVAIEDRKGRRALVANQVESLTAEADRRAEQAARCRALAEAADAEVTDLRNQAKVEQDKLDAAPPLPEPIDADELSNQIAEARLFNQDAERHAQLIAQRAFVEGAAETALHEAQALTRKIEALDAEKAKAISSAKMPVDGIGFGDGFVTLNGFPFDQASAAEQLRASMALAMAANPNVRVLLLRDGSLLDKKSFKIIADMAEKHDFQCWLEVVDSARQSAIIIEDGAVRAEKAAEAAE